MAGSASDTTEDFAAWLQAQREMLEQLAREEDPARLRSELEAWWRRAGVHASAQAHELVARLFEVGEGYLQGLQQFARAAAGQAATDQHAAGRNTFDFGLDLLAAWRSAYSAAGTAPDAATVLLAPWLETLGTMPATGPVREYVNDARELATVHAEYVRIEAALAVILQRVQHEALLDLQQHIAAQAQSADPIRNFQQLYALWIECGERAYAKTANDPEFIRLQAELAQRALCMRNVQRRFAERIARALDLPTRAEVNALHLAVRDLKRQLQERDVQAASSASNKKSSGHKPQAKAAKQKAP